MSILLNLNPIHFVHHCFLLLPQIVSWCLLYSHLNSLSNRQLKPMHKNYFQKFIVFHLSLVTYNFHHISSLLTLLSLLGFHFLFLTIPLHYQHYQMLILVHITEYEEYPIELAKLDQLIDELSLQKLGVLIKSSLGIISHLLHSIGDVHDNFGQVHDKKNNLMLGQ